MVHIILSIVFAFLIALLSTPIMREIALLLSATATKNHRTVHNGAIPKLGGVAVYLGCLGGVLLLFSLQGFPAESGRMLTGLLIGTTLMLLLGITDDVHELNCYEKFAIQVFGATLMTLFGIEIRAITLPILGTLHLGVFTIPFTVLWIVGVANAINLIDGLDGLAVGIVLLATITTLVGGGLGNNILIISLCCVLLGSLLGFFPHNHHKATIFLGDSGSLMLGFLLAILTLQGARLPDGAIAFHIPILALALPLTDTTMAIIRRLKKHVHPFKADKLHIHHRLLNRYKNHRQAVYVLWAFACICQALALSFYFLNDIVSVSLLIISIVTLFVLVRRFEILKVTMCEHYSS